MAFAVAPGFRGLWFAVLLLLPPGAGAAELRPVGRAAPPLVLDRLDGPGFDLSEAAGRPVIVHFFATWCPPCVPEMAGLGRFAERDASVPVVAVDVAEPDARVRRFLADHPTRLAVLMDRDRAAARAWGVVTLPATFVLDAGHAIALAADGPVDWGAPATAALLDGLDRDMKRREGDDEPT